MDYRDLENLGQQLSNRIRDAIDSFDFDRLNQEIRQNAEDIISGTKQSFNSSKTEQKRYYNRHSRKFNTGDDYHQENWQTYKKVRPFQTKARKSASEPVTGTHPLYESRKKSKTQMPDYGFPVERCPKGEVSGLLFTIFGAIGFGLSCCGGLVFGLTAVLSPWLTWVAPLAIFWGFIPLILIFAVMIIIGTVQRNRVKRYRKYLDTLKGKSFITFKDLSLMSGKSQRFIIRDIAHMLNLGYFPEGHMDSHKTCLMVTDAIYEQYLETMKNAQAVQKQNNESPTGSAKTEVDEKITELEKLGKQYMDIIRKANDDIPDIEISNKLYRMEMIIGKIFEHIRKYPQKADRLNQFQNYYMPMTIKLVETYRDIDGQPIEGENIKKVKQEIETTLDTINEAYEKLYDSMYQETAMDVSSDISVLRTLLAREGLTKGAFDKK